MKKNKNQKTLFFGLINKKERWGLSWKGWTFGVLISISFFVFFLKNIYPFLAPINRIESKILVVEGWVNDETMKQAVEEFKSYNYEHVYVTGGAIDAGKYFSEYKTYAHLGTVTLKKLGIESKKVTAVPGPGTVKDRTFTSALALKKYFEDNRIDIKSLNLFTEGPHAKRSQLLFDLAFENKVKIGIVAAKPFYFDPQSWWTSSAGVRFLINELIAYPYALSFKYTQIGSLTGPI
jgi:hypothetical protein